MRLWSCSRITRYLKGVFVNRGWPAFPQPPEQQILLHIDMTASRSRCRFVGCTSMMRISRSFSFFQSSIVQFWWACVNCSLSFLLLADRSGPRCGLLLLQPIFFKIFCIPWLEWVLIWVPVAFLSSGTSRPILLWPLTPTRHFLWIFSLFRTILCEPRDGCGWKSQQISSFWHTQTSPSGTNNHATFKVT